jgi:hypothetical protein
MDESEIDNIIDGINQRQESLGRSLRAWIPPKTKSDMLLNPAVAKAVITSIFKMFDPERLAQAQRNRQPLSPQETDDEEQGGYSKKP